MTNRKNRLHALLGAAAALGLLLPLPLATPERLLVLGAPMLACGSEKNVEKDEIPTGYIKFDVLEVEKAVDSGIRLELIGTRPQPLQVNAGPQILIYHTHTTEAYTPTPENPYEKTTEWRTADNAKNVVRVGEELAKTLREEYGLNVIHDTTNHEPPRLGTSYERSLRTMEDYYEKYPSITLMIDVHRDAYTLKDGQVNKDYAVVDGKRAARVMFVVGTGEGKTGAGFAIKPNYRENYALALAITEKLQGVEQKLARSIRVKTGRYNQHVGKRCLLIEMGHNANTLEEALASVPYVARAIAESTGPAQPEALQFAAGNVE